MSYASIVKGSKASAVANTASDNVGVAAHTTAKVNDGDLMLFDEQVKVRWVKAKKSSSSKANSIPAVEDKIVPKANAVGDVDPVSTDNVSQVEPPTRQPPTSLSQAAADVRPAASETSNAVNLPRSTRETVPFERIAPPGAIVYYKEWFDYVRSPFGHPCDKIGARPSRDKITMGMFGRYMALWKQRDEERRERKWMKARDMAIVEEMLAEAKGESPLWPGRPATCAADRRRWVQSLDVVRPRVLDGTVW